MPMSSCQTILQSCEHTVRWHGSNRAMAASTNCYCGGFSRSPGMAKRRRNVGALFLRQPGKTFRSSTWCSMLSFIWLRHCLGGHRRNQVHLLLLTWLCIILAFRFDDCMPCQSHPPVLHGNQFLLRPSSPLSATPLFHNRDCLTYNRYRQVKWQVIRNCFWWCTFPAVKPCSGGSQIPKEHVVEIGLEIGQLVFHRSTLHPRGWRPMQLIKRNFRIPPTVCCLWSRLCSRALMPTHTTRHRLQKLLTCLPD